MAEERRYIWNDYGRGGSTCFDLRDPYVAGCAGGL